jgi:hypothetical protein
VLGISRHAFGRLVRSQPDRYLRVGARKTAQYAAVRAIRGVASPIPVHEWGPTRDGSARHLLDLVPIEPRGFAIVPAEGGPVGVSDDLPWFLHDFRPQGYLGRQIPRMYPELEAPDDVRYWSADDVLRYATTVASGPPGALVVGNAPLVAGRLMRAEGPRAATVEGLLRELAARVEAGRDQPMAGSSAAGEQPKLLAVLEGTGGAEELVVKYSPPLATELGRRVGDLLVCEHIAGEVINAHRPGWAAESTVHEHGGRMWLFSRRFDRTAEGGRVGCVSLEAVDGEFAGVEPRRWSVAARALWDEGVLTAEDVARVEWLEAFGWGIGNTDMHFGNLALGLEGVEVRGVMPIYDMLPMAWMPRHGEVVEGRVWEVPGDLNTAAQRCSDAVAEFWSQVASSTSAGAAWLPEVQPRRAT